MKTWTNDELNMIGAAEELLLASLRGNDTLRKAVTIWVVRLDNDLFVRAVNGRDGAWFRGTQVRHAGHIQAGGVDKDVSFVYAEPEINDRIDTPYRSKYRRYAKSIVNTILTPEARASTIRLVPR